MSKTYDLTLTILRHIEQENPTADDCLSSLISVVASCLWRHSMNNRFDNVQCMRDQWVGWLDEEIAYYKDDTVSKVAVEDAEQSDAYLGNRGSARKVH